ncbi:uncharacterized protein PHALS_12950 [Plasmopara halstedii]|uniref:Uncharacterized protein n=1 Tax=Plasmopara halstedii TaxID=4781 RepID=A0A0P1AMT4_PLAHL|nr:uncharacterized protein PHALS_12950 [Plasmopara halstedii]CEG42696.1 hypothetical protein PHALS_12950 [Plasmopara halstedii]|eukprot:XP_024579065.1 hypothetical protein PHALS_12950 [Plasmopara halstedii]
MKKFADHMRVFIGRNMNAALLEQSPENLVEILQLKSHELYDSHNFLRFILHIESYQDPLGHPYSNKQTIDLLKANELLGVSFQQAAIFEPIKDIEGHTGRLATNLQSELFAEYELTPFALMNELTSSVNDLRVNERYLTLLKSYTVFYIARHGLGDVLLNKVIAKSNAEILQAVHRWSPQYIERRHKRTKKKADQPV